MATTNVTGQVGPRLLAGTFATDNPLFTSGGSIPDIPQVAFGFGTGLGNINLLAYKVGTATAAAAAIDLSTITDPEGNAINFARVRAVEILNFATADGSILLLDGTVANAWKAPFNAIATAKLVIPPGRTVGTNPVPGGVLLWGANLTGYVTSGTSKVISLDPGAATIPWRVALLGVNA
jgi:hypothetical protein